MEKLNNDPQNFVTPLAGVVSQLLARQDLFASQGRVEKCWRNYRGRRIGPYYRVVFREGKSRKSIHLGRSAELAYQVKAFLAELQRPLRQRRDTGHCRKIIRASLRAEKAKLEKLLLPLGFHMKGYAFHCHSRSRLAERDLLIPEELQILREGEAPAEP
jgi:hypothetical protein